MNAKVLLVEDNEQNRYLATFLLESNGFTVLHASDGKQAVALAQRECPALVLMDIQMPEMDGYEAARLILATPGLEKTPIVAVTSYAMTGDREKALGIGFSGYIEKPISTETFITEISRYLSL